MELCAYIDVVATLPQREYTCCHTQSHTHTRTHCPHTRTRTHYELLLLNTRANSLAYFKAHSPRSFFIFIWFDRFIVLYMPNWLAGIRSREWEWGEGGWVYSIELCPRRTRATCERVEDSASTVFASHARTHAHRMRQIRTEGSNSEREPWLLTWEHC